MKDNIKYKNKGITLITLTISIIILLILVGITTQQLSNSGLFDKTELAIHKLEKAQGNEEKSLVDYEKSINQYIVGNRENIVITKQEYENILKRLNHLEERGTIEEVLNTDIEATNNIINKFNLLKDITKYRYLVIYAGSEKEITETQFIEVSQIIISNTSTQQFTISNYANEQYFWRIGYGFPSTTEIQIQYLNNNGWSKPKIYRIIGIR